MRKDNREVNIRKRFQVAYKYKNNTVILSWNI